MKTKLFENVGGNKFKLLTEAMNPDRAKLIREGLKKVFTNTKKELSYDKVQNFGLGFIKDVTEARKCALQEARDIAPALGFADHPETGTFVKEADTGFDAPTKSGDTGFDDEETSNSPEEKREVQIGKELVRLSHQIGTTSSGAPSTTRAIQKDIETLANELIKMHGAK